MREQIARMLKAFVPSGSRSRPARSRLRTRLEALERREVLTSIVLSGDTIFVDGDLIYPDTITLEFRQNDWWNPFDDQYHVSVTTQAPEGTLTLTRDLGTGGVGRFSVRGWQGNDLIDNRTGTPMTARGDGGHDTILGGSGNDELLGGDGNDWVDGRGGNDFVSGHDVWNGDSWNSTGAGDDTLYGGGGDDTLFGASGNDHLYGGAGADLLIGGAGDDYLDGGNEGLVDTLCGGLGSDTYIRNRYKVLWWYVYDDIQAMELQDPTSTIIDP